MAQVYSPVLRKWLSTISKTLITIASAIVFIFLDFLEVIMCRFFRKFDEFIEGESPSCYCMQRSTEAKSEQNVESLREDELSQSLRGRKNVFREIGLLKIPRIRDKGSMILEEKMIRRNRWSDCGCNSCVSWMKSERDFRLHVVVQERETAMLNFIAGGAVENIMFIHGFLSSSSFWKETVFPNVSRQKYRLLAVDLLGFGRSPKPRECLYTLNNHLEMIEKSAILPFELKSFHLVAHSMGCVVALALAAKYSKSVKSITLVAPPYFTSSEGEAASSKALMGLATRRVWPPLLFATAFMTWYEHLGRCFCFLVCRNHKMWEWILKLFTWKRDLHFSMMDMTQHTHHSAWHTMHNVIAGGAELLDGYLDTLSAVGVKIHVIHGTRDLVVPPQCSYNMKMKNPDIELQVLPNANHNSVILGRENDFTWNLESLWESTGKIET